jgi:hypothetical protein
MNIGGPSGMVHPHAPWSYVQSSPASVHVAPFATSAYVAGHAAEGVEPQFVAVGSGGVTFHDPFEHRATVSQAR